MSTMERIEMVPVATPTDSMPIGRDTTWSTDIDIQDGDSDWVTVRLSPSFSRNDIAAESTTGHETPGRQAMDPMSQHKSPIPAISSLSRVSSSHDKGRQLEGVNDQRHVIPKQIKQQLAHRGEGTRSPETKATKVTDPTGGKHEKAELPKDENEHATSFEITLA